MNEVVSRNLNRNRYVIASLSVIRALPHGFMPRSDLRAWDRERKNSLGTMFFAVRGGLKSRKLVIFKIASEHKDEFIVRKQPQVLDVTHAVPELKAVIEYITQNPCCTRGELLSALVPEGTPAEDAKKIISQLNWVTERGHVIEYHNEVLALPEPHPKYRKLQTGSKEKLTLSADAPAETPAPAVEEPAPQEEAVAEEPAPTEA